MKISELDSLIKFVVTLSNSSSSVLLTSPSSSVANWILVSRLSASISVRKLSNLKCLLCEHTQCSTVFRTDLPDFLRTSKNIQIYLIVSECKKYKLSCTMFGSYSKHFLFKLIHNSNSNSCLLDIFLFILLK